MNERLIALLLDSFPKILLPGLTMTIPLTVISFSIAMVIATAVALIQFAHVKVLSQIARFYIWVVRGTPLLVQLFVVFYGLPDVGILLDPFPAAVLVFAVNEGAYCAGDNARGAGIRSGRADRGGLLRRHALYADHAAHCAAAGTAHRVPAAVQLADCDGEGYVAGLEHHRDGNVYGDAAHCGAHL